MPVTPTKEWWTAAEIADARLPDLPSSRQNIEALAKRDHWRSDVHHARRRAGKGGGWEYSWKLFPVSAQKKLLVQVKQLPAEAAPSDRPDRDEAWSWFERLPEKVQDVAKARLLILQKVETLAENGQGKYLAAHHVSRSEKVGERTIWRWFEMVEGVAPHDRLPYLAPRHRVTEGKVHRVDMSPEFFDVLKADYLRPAAPTFTSCYRRAIKVAKAKGWTTIDERTARRRLNDAVSRETRILARKGVDALKGYYPSQTRDKTALHALEAVNSDFHRFDVFVRWPALPGEVPYIGRPQMVAFQDIYSGRILSWRVDQTPNSEAVRLAAGDMIETYGIPEHVLLDNGREFASKALTGGAPTRFRFKVREDDLPGLFVSLACKIHWATPYSGQSKPIERAFRDMCDSIAKHPRFDGAYTGNSPMAKPEDYGSRAIDLEEFLTVLGEGIEEHNTRQGRWSEVAWGKSFADVFDASYATAPIRKATEEQRRLWLLGAEGLRGDTKSGLVRFLGNEYWADWMHAVAGKRIIARFDPAELWAGLHIYSSANVYLGFAPCKLKAGFFDVGEARSHSKARKTWLNAEKAALDAHRKLKAKDVADLLTEIGKTPKSLKPVAKVVKPIFGKPSKATAEAPVPDDVTRMQAEIVADLAAHRQPPKPPHLHETERDRFSKALTLEKLLKNDEADIYVSSAERRWLAAYIESSEYRGLHMLWEDFGDAMFR